MARTRNDFYLAATVRNLDAAAVRNIAAGLAVAVAVFALSYANGGFDATTKAYAGITAWWLLGLGAATGMASARFGADRLTLAAVGLLASFAVWVLISMRWASDAERAFAQFDQISLYVAVLAIAVALARIVPAGILVGGAGLGLTGIASVALVSRLFPSSFGVPYDTNLLPALAARLSFPVGYWNGLAIEVALAYPLLLAVMTSRRSRVLSAVAALPLPILAADMYFASSRGAFVAAGIGMLGYLVLTPRRWAAVAAIAVAGVGSGAAVAALVHKKALVNGLTSTAIGVSQGHRAALLIGAACVVSALAWLGLAELGRRLPSPPRVVAVGAVVAVVVLAVAALVLSHPIRKFDEFKTVSVAGQTASTATTAHLLGTSGSGRWQFWSAALSEFRAHPLNGGGAGSYGAWWLQHGSLPAFTESAHSLYLEALAELGIIGLLLLGGAVLAGVVGAVRSARALQRADVAAAAACGCAFFVAAAYDWVWQLAGVALVGVGMLGVALGSRPSTRKPSPGGIGAARPALAVLAVGAVIAQFVVLAAGVHLRNSQAAVNAGDGARARSQALAAKAIEPWAATPLLQLSLVYEAEHDYGLAAQWIGAAIKRSPRDWSLWETAARIETERGHVAQARRDLAEARRLNPHQPLFR
ncbi:MAG TPA: O-antigen ligase family protein [Gaiellaceae bacterium]|nr:O-antigen ligase family protein [Gaiellaceae bacterium]